MITEYYCIEVNKRYTSYITEENLIVASSSTPRSIMLYSDIVVDKVDGSMLKCKPKAADLMLGNYKIKELSITEVRAIKND